jgi:hypothetical protein
MGLASKGRAPNVEHLGIVYNPEPGNNSEAFRKSIDEAAKQLEIVSIETLPLFVSCTEIDLPAAITQAKKAISARRAAGRPSTYAMFRNHSHISQNYSIGTADTSVSAPILEFIHQLE